MEEVVLYAKSVYFVRNQQIIVGTPGMCNRFNW